MEVLAPLINLLVFMTVLSMTAERITNILKLRNDKLRMKQNDENAEREREYAITWRGMLIGIILSILVKANFFEVMTHLDDPWSTLGWVQMRDYYWVVSPVLTSVGAILLALAGCIITGVGLGFGNKFWHDFLGIVYETRDKYRKLKRGELVPPPPDTAQDIGSA